MYLSLFSILSNAQTPSDPCLPNQQTLFIRSQAFLAGAIAIGDFPGSTIKKASDLINTPLIPHTGNNFTNDFKITGNFIIDKSINFNGCRVFMAANSAIGTTSTSAIFTSNGAKFMSEGMWKGIVGKVGNIVLNADTEIEDAIVGLTLSPFSKGSYIQGTIFNRNQIGIVINSSTGSNTMVFKKPMRGNTFTCTSELNMFGANDYKWSISGICIRDVNVPTLSTATNIFSRILCTGIEIYGTARKPVVNIEGCQFLEISYKDANFPIKHPLTQKSMSLSRGYGIYADYASIKVKGFGVAEALNIKGANEYGRVLNTTPAFRNCQKGAIQTEHCDLDMNNCNVVYKVTNPAVSACVTENLLSLTPSFKSTGTLGIVNCISNIATEVIQISGNHFDINLSNSEFIFGFGCLPIVSVERSSAYTEINSNSFNYMLSPDPDNDYGGELIRLKGISSNNSSFAYITTNRIKMVDTVTKRYSSGITTAGVNNIVVSYNEIDADGAAIEAIVMAELAKSYAKGNKINNGGSGKIRVGICANAQNNPANNNQVICNTINACHVGLWFDGNCDKTVVADNILKDCETRLLLDQQQTAIKPFIGNQFRRDAAGKVIGISENKFMNTSPNLSSDARNNGNINLSLFKVTSVNDYVPMPQKNVFPSKGWFKFEPGLAIDTACGRTLNLVTQASISAAEEDIIAGKFDEDLVDIWEAECELMYQLSINPRLLDESPEALVFYNARLQTSLLKYAQIRHEIKDILTIPSTDFLELIDWKQQKERNLSYLDAVITQANALSNEEEWSAELLQSFDYYNNVIANLDALIIAKETEIKADRLTKATMLLAEVASLSALTIHETINKELYELQLNYFIHDGLNNAETNRTFAIANLCLNWYGTAVYRANTLLPLSLKKEPHEILKECSSATNQYVKANPALLFPNPADIKITLPLDIKELSNFCTVSDFTGRVIFQTAIEKEQFYLDIDTAQFAQGIYFINTYQNQTLLHHNKFMVIH